MMSGARLWRIWAMPIVLACLSAIGIVAALLANGLGDALSWLSLAVVAGLSLRVLLRAWYPGRRYP